MKERRSLRKKKLFLFYNQVNNGSSKWINSVEMILEFRYQWQETYRRWIFNEDKHQIFPLRNAEPALGENKMV